MSDVKVSVKLSHEFNDKLEKLSQKFSNGNKSELMRKLVALIDIYEREHNRTGADLALISDGKINSRLLF